MAFKQRRHEHLHFISRTVDSHIHHAILHLRSFNIHIQAGSLIISLRRSHPVFTGRGVGRGHLTHP